MSAGKQTLKHKKHRKKGFLWLIVLCLISSAALRIVGPSGAAIASSFEDQGVESNENECPEDLQIILDRLREREKAVATAENELQDKQAAISFAEKKVREQLVELENAEERLSKLVAFSSQAAETDLEKLTEVYQNMKPKEAAELFAKMDPEFAAGFLSRMRADSAAKILAGLTPETAYSISAVLAGRNANAPK